MHTTPLRHALAALATVALTALAAPAQAQSAAAPTPAANAGAKEKAIFAVTDADPQKWNLTLGNIANAVDGLGKDNADVELVVYGPAIVMLKKDTVVADKLAAVIASGVRVTACHNSMRGFKIEPADLAPGVTVVPAGVVELIRREHDGYAYVRS